MAGEKKGEYKAPAFLAKHGLGKGTTLTLSKEQLYKRTEPLPTNTISGRIWACGVLHTNGYGRKDQMAVKVQKDGLHAGEIVPLTIGDIQKELFATAVRCYQQAVGRKLTPTEKMGLWITSQHLRRGIEYLERDGSVERRTDTGLLLRQMPPAARKAVDHSRIRLFFFYRPVAAEKSLLDENSLATEWLVKLPKNLEPIFRRIKRLGLTLKGEQLSLFSGEYLPLICGRLEQLDRFETETKDFINALLAGNAPATAQEEPRRADTPQPAAPQAAQAPDAASAPASAVPVSTNDRTNGARPADGTNPPQEATDGGAPAGSAEITAALAPFRPAAGADDPATAELVHEEFHRRVVASFEAAGIPIPSRRQTRPVFDQLGSDAPAFAEAVSPQLLKQRRAKNPGILPIFVEEFQEGRAARQAREADQEQQQAEHDRRNREAAVTMARELLTNPSSSELERKIAQEILEPVA